MLRTKQVMQDLYMDIENSVDTIKNDPSQKNLKELQYVLNKFYDESECKGVIYTNNIDKLFFGLIVMPEIKAEDVIDIITKDKRYIIKKYFLEIDSKLFGDDLKLSSQEITALLLHDIGMLVNDSAPCENVKRAIDRYLEENHQVLKLSDSIHYQEILSYGFRDALRKSTTIFEKSKYIPDDQLTDEFIDWTNYEQAIQSAFNKINALGLNYNREVDNKFLVLSWVLRVYRDVLHNRIPALKVLERGQLLTASQIERKEMNNMARRLNRIDDDALLESYSFKSLLESKSLYKSLSEPLKKCADNCDIMIIKTNNALNDDDDYQNPDVIPDLLHSINNQMTMIDDYVNNNDSELNKEEFKQWNAMFKNMAKLRHNIVKNSKMYNKQRKMYNTWKAQDNQ